MIDLLNSDARRIPLADQSVQCIITSPPYFGLRDYDTATWQGGDPKCDHVDPFGAGNTPSNRSTLTTNNGNGPKPGDKFSADAPKRQYRDICAKCGAIRIDAQIGLERVPDCLGWATGKPCGECYVCHIVAAMRECWRVLRDDGVMWLNMGDSYASGEVGRHDSVQANSGRDWSGTRKSTIRQQTKLNTGLKPKNLCMIPARVALALQADGWYLRSMIPWLKRNSMPESVTDRPSSAVEYVYLFSKSNRYYFDIDSIRIPVAESSIERLAQDIDSQFGSSRANGGRKKNGNIKAVGRVASGRNRRNSDWFFESWQGLYMVDDEPAALIVNPQPYSGAHFATFPPALVEPMILAGTSARGACPACGKAWSRVIEPSQEYAAVRQSMIGKTHEDTSKELEIGKQQSWGKDKASVTSDINTLGWRPACSCYDVPPLPDKPDDTGNGDMAAYRAERARLLDLYATLPVVLCIVLDPFAGSGTVGKVAVKHGRRFVGCELNREYIDLAFERTSKVQTVMQL